EKLNINLNDKEIACLQFWVGGISIKETAHRLNLSSKTIEAYRGNIKSKMAIHHKFQLMQRLFEVGIYSPRRK
ncbi:LuxR C-terminal-related transcriptional regulator, partial [Acinetobacter baumannii]